ncbi:Uma2 family endonuclease [Phaeodactylibacter sp.]|uniref:Uma2 family endonuclease n=1 Tax=Phaeodactylibacter sp. TaxID=1940289 RepID=UPI0025E7079B|nr:Uma2 family endonuclease [Phaeodactylibacter sp.]MCI4646589.1 Uma2 family endonuclease [Phaeodactylibacter sp.]MCI5091595.1 Uma2 family endonuclease [Phaeodactylibacter sp.]
MSTAVSIPLSLSDRLKLGPELHRFSADYATFIDVLQQVEYPVEFEDGSIIIMSIASDHHEQLVANLLGVLFVCLKGNTYYRRYGSNRHVFIEHQTKAYAPDVSVVQGIPSIHEYAPGKTAHTNPWMVAEVISPSSRNRDFGEKLQGYKSIASLQYILYLEQDRPYATLFERLPGTERWKSTDFNDTNQDLQVGAFEIQMSDLYQGLF